MPTSFRRSFNLFKSIDKQLFQTKDSVIYDSKKLSSKSKLTEKISRKDTIHDFQRLPQELLDQILGYLSLYDVKNFAAYSRQTFNAALPMLYESISLDMTKVDFLSGALKSWSRVLQNRNALWFVKTIKLKGRKWTYGPSFQPSSSARPIIKRKAVGAKTNTISKITIMNRFYMEDYRLVIDFFRSLPRLVAIDISLEDILPPILLAFLKENHQLCCIGLQNITFRLFFCAEQDIFDTATLENLRSISLTYDHLHSYVTEQSLLSKTLEFLVRNGPKLEHVNLRITNCLYINSDWSNTILEAFQSRMNVDSFKGKLTSLAISYCNMSWSTSGEPSLFVVNLNTLLDTSCLHDLKLSGF